MGQLLERAKIAKASDVHITVGIAPKMRVNGDLYSMEYAPLYPKDTKEMIEEVLTPNQRSILEEKGEVDFSFSIATLGRFRVNAFKQRGSYAAAIRLVGTSIPSAVELGVPPSVVELYKKKKGLVLVTGPTGSGKSTTLASLIDKINKNRNAHVITLEDPIEYLHQHSRAIINQREIGLDSQSYANALRAALREDPDIILIGEMRDLDTIQIAITAAETGHLVFSTLHTIGAVNTIDRIIDVFPPHQQQQIRIQLSFVLEAVISQQLVPTVDKKHRVASFEVMHATLAVRNLLREGKTHQISSVLQTGKKHGMQTMDDALLELYFQGVIDREQTRAFAQDLGFVERKLL